MPFELSPDVIYRIQNVQRPSSYLSVGVSAHGGCQVVCTTDNTTDKRQQVRRASGFTTINTNHFVCIKWRFIHDAKSGCYTIRTVDDPCYLTYPSYTNSTVIVHSTGSARWTVNPGDSGVTT